MNLQISSCLVYTVLNGPSGLLLYGFYTVSRCLKFRYYNGKVKLPLNIFVQVTQSNRCERTLPTVGGALFIIYCVYLHQLVIVL